MSLSKPKPPILSTAGAIPYKNEKGQITMEKVKVARYVSGKRPEYAPDTSDEEEDDNLETKVGVKKSTPAPLPTVSTEAERDDRRLKRLQERHREEDSEEDEDDRVVRHRRIHEPEVLGESSDEDEDGAITHRREQDMDESSEEEEELDEEEIERRRAMIRERARQRREEEEKQELMDVEDEEKEGSGEESSEYEEYTDSEEDEQAEPRLKPVFVRKKDRATIQEKEREEEKQKQLELENKKLAEERRKQTLRMVADDARRAREEQKELAAEDAINTDDDNDEEEYEAWKVRELKRLKRDREERELIEKEQMEAERLHNMTEEERREELKRNPKQIINKAAKGKYKFLQKYYHRGAFFLDKEENVFTRDFAAPTLEDHFNKTILPKVMQVKNFGRSGRTKYTHLVDQDTTEFESPWMSDTSMNLKFHTTKGGGMKQGFERPNVKKRK